MKKKSLKTRLWEVLGNIQIPPYLQELYLSQNCRIGGTKNHLRFVEKLFSADTQREIIFSKDREEIAMLQLFSVDLIKEYMDEEQDETMQEYYRFMYKSFIPQTTILGNLIIRCDTFESHEADMLCRLIQLHLTPETQETFRRAMTTLLLYSDHIKNKDLLNQILNYYKNYKIK